MILTVPKDLTMFPTLGPQVCDFIEANLVFGPGDLRGKPAVLDDEKLALIYRMYEVYPPGHPRAGKRRFRRVGISLPKGLAKTELAAWIAACELHPEAPVRCVGWSPSGEPIGGPVTDPYIPMVAFSEEQSSELAYAALKTILEEGPLKDDFDIGLERIMRKKGDGIAVSLSSNPNARDGARTTFAVCDETHRWTLQRLRDSHKVMQTNLVKRPIAEPWMLEITTAPEPGTGSVAEATYEYAKAVDEGKIRDADLFYFHRQASDDHDLTSEDGVRAAIVEASGPAAAWRDIDGIASLWKDPTTDKPYLERVYLNRLRKGSTQAFDVVVWKALAREREIKPGALIALGLDGAVFHDSTALVATDVVDGFQWPINVWEKPTGDLELDQPWRVPADEVDQAVDDCFERFQVCRFYADPPYWESYVAKWIGRYGKDVVVEWWTNRRQPMAAALRAFNAAIKAGHLTHSGDARILRHVGNSRRDELKGYIDEQGQPLWLIRKDRPDSPHKIDAAMASVLSWEARNDAIAAGATVARDFQVMVVGGRKR